MEGILLLNATYEPLSILSLRRAARLLLKERAEPVVTEPIVPLASPERTLEIPTVLRLKFYVNVPRRNPPAWTRRGLLARDGYRCAYCGKVCSPGEATVDHVLPISRGGRSSWSNTVTACFACNQRKADRTPQEAGMKLLIEPKLPRTRYLTIQEEILNAWKVWIKRCTPLDPDLALLGVDDRLLILSSETLSKAKHTVYIPATQP
jgi:5-methylcytosine-specific restriction endonuclease McrA